MHNIDIPAAQLARVADFRDQRHMFARLVPSRTAHIVVDLQNGFMEPGAPIEVPVAREIVPNVNSISTAVRRCGGRNVFLRMTVDSDSQSSWSNWFAYLNTPQSAATT